MGKKLISAAIFTTVLTTLACGIDQSTSTEPLSDDWMNREYRCGERTLGWKDVNDWHYQLQNANYVQLADSKYDLIVMDSEPEEPPNRNVIDRIKCSGEGEKLVLSYLAIGEIEDYRYFWQDDWAVGSPPWIGSPNPNWPGDYYVRYWEPEWKKILMGSPESRVDRIVEAGFDGVYLDNIDSYQIFLSENPDAIEDMRQLVSELAVYARRKSANPDFGVFVQNAAELIEVVGPSWIEPLTGIGKEEAFFWAMDERVDSEEQEWNTRYLDQWVKAGKIVLSVDYVAKESNRHSAVNDARERGYIPLTLSSNELDRMDKVEGFEPD